MFSLQFKQIKENGFKKPNKKGSHEEQLDQITRQHFKPSQAIRTNKAENTHMWFNTILCEANLLSFAQSVKISQIPLPLNPGG